MGVVGLGEVGRVSENAFPATLLIVSADAHLVAELTRLSAAAGVQPDVVADPAAAVRAWTTAGLVLVGADIAGLLGGLGPPRRDQVHVVALGPPPSSAFADALACGAQSVVAVPDDAPLLVELLTDVGDGSVRVAVTVGVVGGAGGVGATVFATALASACAERVHTLIIDADVLGSGVDQVLGLDGVEGVRWDALLATTGRLGARALRDALPRRDGLAVLGWPRDHRPEVDARASREVLSAACRGFDVVVLDLPRYPHTLATELVPRCDLVLLVSTLTVPAVAAAARVADRLPPAATHLVLRGSAAGVDPAEASRFLGLPVAAVMAGQRRLDEGVSLGVGPVRGRRGPLARASRAVAADVVSLAVASGRNR